MDQPAAISLRHLTKTYRIWQSPEARLQAQLWRLLRRPDRAERLYSDFCALRDITLEVAAGQSIGVIGLNGSGKSTLLQLMAGTLQPSAGEVSTRGRVAALLELGAGFNPDFTGRENVYLNAAVLGLTKEETDERFPDIAAFADIGGFIDQPVKTYSSGMYVRLAFAVLTQVRPDVLIIDEALAVGDFLFQQKCFDVMRRFRERGVTFFFVSHSMGMVLELCDRVIVLDRGRMIFDGPAPQAVAVYEENAVRARYGGQVQAAPAEGGARPARREGGQAAARLAVFPATPNLDQAALRAEPGSIHSPEAQLVFARFLDADGREKALFRTGEDMIVSLGFAIQQPLAEPHVGFKVRDRLGRVLFETSSLCLREAPAPAQAGDLLVGNFRFKVTLADGEYGLVVGLSEGAVGDRDYRRALFYVQQVRTFVVVPSPGDVLWSGMVHLYPKFGWSIFPEEGPSDA